MTSIPSLFVSHGGPNIVTDPSEARDYLEGLSERLPRPKAIVVMSAHFETERVSVVTDPKPGMIHDFRGFAPELYQMVYPAPGDPSLAERVFGLLAEAGLEPSRIAERGYDHGTWTPLRLAFPNADIPVVQVSVDPARDAAWHYRIGRALAPLREEGILLVGSGHITHNLRALMPLIRGNAEPDQQLAGHVGAFVDWFAKALEAGDTNAILDWRRQAPFAVENHPTDEHLMPIFFAYGAAGDAPRAERAHASRQQGVFAFDSYLFH